MTTLGSDTFTGANGAALDSAKWTTFLCTGASATIQNNQCQLSVPGPYANGCNILYTGAAAIADSELVIDVILPATLVEEYLVTSLRASEAAANTGTYPDNGYVVELDYSGGNAALHRVVNAATTTLASTTMALTAGATYRIRMRISGSRIQWRMWNTSGAEPSTWDIDYTDASPYSTAGRAFFSGQSGASSSRVTVTLDNFTWTDLTSGTAYTASPADSQRLTDAATPQQALARNAADHEGLTDAVTPLQALTRTATDSEGLTDAVTLLQALARGAADSQGLTDAVTLAQSLPRSAADHEGLTDSVTAILSTFNQTFSDSEGLTDAATALQSLARSPADHEGLADAATALQSLARSAADHEGLTDGVVADLVRWIVIQCGDAALAAAPSTAATLDSSPAKAALSSNGVNTALLDQPPAVATLHPCS